MKLAVITVGFLLAAAGLLFIANGFFHPQAFKLDGASAPQVAQVYSESIFIIVQGIALWVVAIGIGIGLLISDNGKDS